MQELEEFFCSHRELSGDSQLRVIKRECCVSPGFPLALPEPFGLPLHSSDSLLLEQVHQQAEGLQPLSPKPLN